MKHWHLCYVPIWEPHNEVRSGAISSKAVILLLRDSLLRNKLALWANPDPCEDTDCKQFSAEREFGQFLNV